MAFLKPVQVGTTNKWSYFATGASHIAESLSVFSNDVPFVLVEIRIHLSKAGAANDLTATVDSNAGTAYDTIILTQDMSLVVDLQEVYDDNEKCFQSGDQLDFAWTNGGSATWGLEVIVEPK